MHSSKPERGAAPPLDAGANPEAAAQGGALPDAPGLTAWLHAHGDLREVAGNTPFLLDDPAFAWMLLRGAVELFLVRVEGGQPQGMRHHFASLAPGAFMPGLSPDLGDLGYCLLAVPHVGTQVCRVSQAAFRRLGQDVAVREALIRSVEAWVHAVSDGLAHWITPRPRIGQALVAGESAAVAAHQRASASRGVIWTRLPRDAVLYLDSQDLPPGTGPCDLPMTSATWFLSHADLDVTARTTADCLAQDAVWAGLDVLHAVLFPIAELNVRLAQVDEHNRMRQRSESVDRDWDRGLRSLGTVMDAPAVGLGESVGAEPPLVTALALVGRVEGFTVKPPPPRARDDEDRTFSLAELARSSGLRRRTVLLEPGWHRQLANAMLGEAADDGRPLAILPGRRGLRVVDPTRGTAHTGEDALALLGPQAVALTAPLPFRVLTWGDVPRFTLARTWRDLIALILTGAAGGLLGMAAPIASAYLIDKVIPAHDRGQLVEMALVLAVLGVAAFIMSVVGAIAFSRFESRAGPAVQAAMIDRLLRLPVGFFRDFSAGDLAMRASAVTHIQQMVSGAAAGAVMAGVFSVFSFGLLLYYDLRMGLWAVLLTAIYVCATLALTLMRLARERPLAEMDGRLQSLMLQLITGIAKLRLSASEDRAFVRWAMPFAKAQRLRAGASALGSAQTVLNGFFGIAALFFFFLVMGNFGAGLDENALAIGSFAAFLAAFGQFNGSVTQMTQTITSLIGVKPLFERARPLLRATPEVGDGREDPGVLSGGIELSHVSFRYDENGPLVLDDVSITARPGEFVALVGASGSGKSTLLRLLLGFETPDAGGILLDGQDVRDLDVLAARRQMGVVLQNSRPMPGSLYDNIVGVTGGTVEQAWEAASRVGLADDIRAMPMGMHTVVTEGSGSLSGGQLQRLMIARAIVGSPRILLLDEATSALDNRTQAVVTDSLERLSVTRIVVAHRLSTIERADRIVVLDHGRVVESGTFAELMQRDGAFARLAAAQIV